LAAWLRRFDGVDEVVFAVEACTGWRYVSEELAAAGRRVVLAEPAETAAARGPKRRAKTDRADSRLLRELAVDGRVPRCWVPPQPVLEARALLQCYHDLRREHTAWVQRVHAVLFHQGVPAVGSGGVSTAAGQARVAELAAARLSPAGQVQVATALAMLQACERQLYLLRQRLIATARRLRGAGELSARIYGVGLITGLALTCWLGGAGRFCSSRKAVRFTGLDITVYSSDGKRGRGRLSRQGPAVLRWCLYEAGKASARRGAPDHAYYAAVKDRAGGNRAALSEARKIVRQACHILTELGDDAFEPAEPTAPTAPAVTVVTAATVTARDTTAVA
jgi:transposase